MSDVPFSLATMLTSTGERAAILVQDHYYWLDLASGGALSGGVRALFNHWDASLARLGEIADDCARDGRQSAALLQLHQVALATPIRFPNKLICVGAVYSDHLLEMKLPATRWPIMPFFIRAPTTSLVGPGRTVHQPSMTKEFDWEIELVVVVGRQLTDATPEQATAAIAGYCVGIDLTCRDLIDRSSPLGVDLVRAKSQDGMAPAGPVFRPAQFVGDPQQLALKLWVNGDLKQNGTTANMLFPVSDQLSTISRYITLEPGDMVFTGSPAGSGGMSGRFLQPGDHIRAEISRVGTLEVEILPPRVSR
jgi:2-keto-4-pentenoate hydratase/2-oxohepta-3-ene-1,7-dioic acid hydratase in catechol pathway